MLADMVCHCYRFSMGKCTWKLPRRSISALVLTVVAILPKAASAAPNKKGPWFRDLPVKGSELFSGVHALPDPMRPYESLIDQALAAKASIQTTDACKTQEYWEPVVLSRVQRAGIAPDGEESDVSLIAPVAIDGAAYCVRVGYPVHFVLGPTAAGLFIDVGWYFPTAISGPRPAFAAEEEQLLLAAGLLNLPAGSAKPAPVFLSGRWLRASVFHPVLGEIAPMILGARGISRSQMETAVQERRAIVDLRPPAQFAIAKIAGATNVPYSMGDRLIRKGVARFGSSQYAENGDMFDVRKLPRERGEPIILIGTNFADGRTLRAAAILRDLQYRKIFFFAEGMDFFLGMAWRPPQESSLAKAVSVSEARRMIEDPTTKAVAVDVRSAVEVARGTVANAIAAPFAERTQDIYYRRPELNGRLLRDFGDHWEAPASVAKNANVILFGDAATDWRGYKAALVAQALGYTNVYWLRDGFAGWRQSSAKEPSSFRIDAPVAQ